MQTLEKAFDIFKSLPSPKKHHNTLSVLDKNGKLYTIIQYPGQKDYYEELFNIEKDKLVFKNPFSRHSLITISINIYCDRTAISYKFLEFRSNFCFIQNNLVFYKKF
jgi:hypothetical protein